MRLAMLVVRMCAGSDIVAVSSCSDALVSAWHDRRRRQRGVPSNVMKNRRQE